MCFSAEASFAGGAVLLAVGVATVRKVNKPSQLLFASIPLLFATQQISEGFLWLTLPHPEYETIQKITTYIFLFVADFLWPTWIPLAVLMMEKEARRKQLLKPLLALGSLVSTFYAYQLLFTEFSPQIVEHHIKYNADAPTYLALWIIPLYLVATIAPLLVSSVKKMPILGILMFVSCLIAAIFFIKFLTSVWCFFGAIISIVIYWILKSELENQHKDNINR